MQGLVTFEQFLAFLKENNVPHKVNADVQLVGLANKGAPLPDEFLWIKWEKKLPFIQYIQHMIENVPDDRVHDVETAITRLNCQLEIPGFTFDHSNNRLSLRMCVPVFPPEGISPVTFHQLGQGCVNHAKEFLPALQAVVGGEPGDKIIDIVKAKAAAAKGNGGDGALA